MERWQDDYITKNLLQLLNNTLCDTSLLACLQSSEIIGVNDVQSIRAKRQEREKAYLLYEILKTRTNGYLSLMKALQDCGQSGAYNILMNGVSEFGFANLKINFHNTTKSLEEILVDPQQIKELLLKLKTSLRRDTFLDLILMHQTKENAVALVRDTIPVPLPYYVQRRLSRKNEVNSKIFKEECTDIFVFKGVTRAKLTELVQPNPTTSSSSQLMQIKNRFIFLEQEADWVEIRNNARHPAHLIQLEEGNSNFFLLDTSEPSQVLRKYLQCLTVKLDECGISENEFIAGNLQKHFSSNICICDTPGMGKSALLANLARKLIQISSPYKQIVAFIPFSQFLHHVNISPSSVKETIMCGVIAQIANNTPAAQEILRQLIESKSIKLVLCLDSFDQIKSEDLQRAKNVLSTLKNDINNVSVFITTRPHMRNDLETTLGLISYDIIPFTENDQLNFLTDYWRESLPETQCQDRLTKFSKLCIQNLQKVLSKQKRDIMGIPLQCSLLAQVYTKQAGWYSSLSRKPSETLQSIFPGINSVYDLYSKFFDLRFNQQFALENVYSKHHKRRGPLNSIISTAKKFHFVLPEGRLGICANNDQLQCIEIVKKFHIFKALQILFPSLADEYALHAEINTVTHSIDTFLPFGILEARINGDSNSKSAEFVHRTFAEFLVAIFFTEILAGKIFYQRKHEKFKINAIKFFAENVMSTCPSDDRCKCALKLNYYQPDKHFRSPMERAPELLPAFLFKNSVIIYFLNEHLARTDLKTFPDHWILRKFLPIPNLEVGNPSNFYKILAGCVASSSVNLLRLLKLILMPANSHMGPQIQPEERINEFRHLICLAAGYSNLDTLRECVDFFREYFQLDIRDLNNKWQLVSRTPLHFAIERGYYDMVEYLVDKISLEGRSLLYYCIDTRTMKSCSCSYMDSDEVVKNRIPICELLLNKEKSLLTEVCYNCRGKKYDGPLVALGIHLKLVKLLAREGADVRAIFDKKNIVYRAISYMTPADFHELCRFLIEECQAGDLFKTKGALKKTPLLHKITFHASKAWDCTIKMILKNVKDVDMNETEQDGNNLIGSAVFGNRSMEAIKFLVKQGVNLNHINKAGQSVLHLAVERGHIQAIDYFISLGLSLNDCDNNGNTPFFSVLKNFAQTVEHMVAKYGEDVHKTDKNRDTIAHKTCRTLYVNDFNDLTVVVLVKPSNGGGDIFKVKNHHGKTPLHIWLANGRVIPVTTLNLILSKSGLDVNDADADGNNLFLSACEGRQNVSVLKCLVGFGADSKHCNKQGRNAFHLSLTAMQRNFFTAVDRDIIEYIAGLEVNLDQPDPNCITPLDLAREISDPMHRLLIKFAEKQHCRIFYEIGKAMQDMLPLGL